MKSKLIILSLLFSLFSPLAYSQNQAGAINGVVSDAKTKETLGFATVELYDNGIKKAATPTDADGNYEFKNLEASNNYSIKVTYVGYNEVEIKGIGVSVNLTTKVNVQMTSGTLQEVEVIEFKKKLFEADNTTTGGTMTSEDISHVAYHSINAMAATSAGVSNISGGLNIKGDRTDGTIYFVDGVRVVGSQYNVPQSSIEQLSVLTGGIPAEYGDATGGVVSITTKGPSKTFSGGIDALSSEFLDPYGYNNIDGNLSGPLITKYKDTDSAKPILGFFVSGNYLHELDPNPSAVPIYVVKPSVLNSLNANPLVQNPTTNLVDFIPAADFINSSDMQTSKVNPNVQAMQYNFTGKLNFQPSPNINFSFGGGVQHNDYNSYSQYNEMFDPQGNPEVIINTYSAYANYRQTFNSAPNSAVKNAYYTVHFDYTSANEITQDPNLKTNFFNYSYVGQFKEYRQPFYAQGYDTINGKRILTKNLVSYVDTLITFNPGTANSTLTNYTEEFYKANNNRVGSRIGVSGLSDLANEGALINGNLSGLNPAIVYSLWNDVGEGYQYYTKSQDNQYNISLTGGASIKKHDITFGIQYTQYVERYYQIDAGGLWTLMRQLEDLAVPGTVDPTKPMPVYDSLGNFTNVVKYPLAISDSPSTFAKNFEKFLIANHVVDAKGQPIGSGPYPYTVDQYSPKDFSLNWFSADDLLNSGNSIVSYYGYDYLGNKTTGKVTFNDFLNNSQRLIAPFAPTYVAGFVEDKFEFKDLICRIGLRVDRYEANENVLVDPYSLYPTRTASEVPTLDPKLGNVPSDIGGNYVVYVDNAYNPTKITGFRNGSTWYDASGNEISDPSVIANQSTGGATASPWLVSNSKTQTISNASFTSYAPAVNVMPRIAFSFPISEDAVFYANYDVLTQAPRQGTNLSTITDYYFITERATNAIDNPNLLPSKRINYEVGFKQKLTRISAVSLQAFYGEMNNQEDIVPINYAYPINYTTFGNVDFGTVKGFLASYDLRRAASSGVELLINYTLQFANGTGSNVSEQANLVSSGQPNLKVPFPLDYDVRHQIVGTLDYRFGDGPEYTGPKGKTAKKIFKNLGFNIIGNGRSGTPYSGAANATEAVGIGIRQSSILLGTVNGDRLPWQFRFDAKIDKEFAIERHAKKDQTKQNAKAPIYCDAYLTVQNVLNTLNVIGVYRYTGSPSDDGFLNSSVGQQTLLAAQNEQALIAQYNAKVNAPGNYSLPRLIRLGLTLSF